MNPPLSIPHEKRAVFDTLSQRFCALNRRKESRFEARTAAFRLKLQGIYPNAEACVLYSILSGTPPRSGGVPFDFPGPHSIERFINKEYAAAFPEHVLFSFLSDMDIEAGDGMADLPEEAKRILEEDSYESPLADAFRARSIPFPAPLDNGAAARMEWLEKPLQLKPSHVPPKKKVTIPPGEHPFHASFDKKPLTVSRPPTGFKHWLKRCLRKEK